MRAPDHEADGGEQTLLGSAEDDEAAAAEKAAAEAKSVEEKAAAEAKTAEETAAAEAKAAAEAAAKEKAEQNEFLGAPEGDYEIAGLPDGVTVDTEVLGALAPVLKEIGLNNAAASKLAGVYNAKILPHLQSVVQKDIEGQTLTLGKEWDTETRLEIEGGKDKDGKAIEPIKGKDGQPLYGGKSVKEVQQVAARALDRFAGPELREFLEASKLGNHPALMRFSFLVGTAIKEDDFERGGGDAKPKSRVQKYYDRTT